MPSNWNRLMDALSRGSLSGREAQVVAAIARKTLGFTKAADTISASQIAAVTRIGRSHVAEILKRLEERKVIRREGGCRGRAAVISLNLETPWLDERVPPTGQVNVSRSRDRFVVQRVPLTGSKPVPLTGHTRGKGVKTSQAPPSKTLQQRAFEAYLSAGGSLRLEKERDTLASSVTRCAKQGVDEELILAACRELGRKGEFPGFLKQRVTELQERGGPCAWEGLGRLRLTRRQLLECGCPRCREWAEAGEEGAASSRPTPAGLSLPELARSMRRSGDGARELVDELIASGLAAESSPGCYRLSREAEERYGEGLRLLGSDSP